MIIWAAYCDINPMIMKIKLNLCMAILTLQTTNNSFANSIGMLGSTNAVKQLLPWLVLVVMTRGTKIRYGRNCLVHKGVDYGKRISSSSIFLEGTLGRWLPLSWACSYQTQLLLLSPLPIPQPCPRWEDPREKCLV